MLKYEPANSLFQDDSVVLHLSCDYYKRNQGLKLQVCVPEENSPAITQPPYRSASNLPAPYSPGRRYISSYSTTAGTGCDRSAIGAGGGALHTGIALLCMAG